MTVPKRQGPGRGPAGHTRRSRTPPAHRVKTGTCYDVAEIAALLQVHRNTVRHWIRLGLRPLDNKRPMVIHGSELRRFLMDRRQRRRVKCGPGEVYCLRCRAARKPWDGAAEVRPITPKLSQIVALCPVCEGLMHRMIRADAAALFMDEATPQTGAAETNRPHASQSEL